MNELEDFLKNTLEFQNILGVKNTFDFITGRDIFSNQKEKENEENSEKNTLIIKKEEKNQDNDLSDVNNLDDLVNIIKKNNKCDLKKYAKNDVIFDGCKNAKIMLIGEAPGANEDLEGKPFCGKSGKLLRNALKYINLDTSNLFITNTVFWRPPENRKPTDQELQICKPFLFKMIEIIKPKIIILCGSTATSSFLNNEKMNQSVGKIQTKKISFNNFDENIEMFPIYHPSFLLRQPSMKKIFWKHLLILKNEIIKLGRIK